MVDRMTEKYEGYKGFIKAICFYWSKFSLFDRFKTDLSA